MSDLKKKKLASGASQSLVISVTIYRLSLAFSRTRLNRVATNNTLHWRRKNCDSLRVICNGFTNSKQLHIFPIPFRETTKRLCVAVVKRYARTISTVFGRWKQEQEKKQVFNGVIRVEMLFCVGNLITRSMLECVCVFTAELML